jgi:hypothetical protein
MREVERMSKEIKDKQIELDGVIIPCCEEGGMEWHPIKYIVEQFLLKSYNTSIVNKYNDYTRKQVIDYTFKGTSPQKTNCMNKDGWIKYLNECKLNKNKDTNKIKRHNILCDYFGCENKYEIIEDIMYDDYIKDCIAERINYNINTKFKRCTNCGRELPIHKDFFPKDNRTSSGFLNVCKMCNTPNNTNYFCSDTQAREIYSIFGNEGYLLYKEDIKQFYIKYIHSQNKFKLHIGNREETKLFIVNMIDYYYKNKLIKVENINKDYIYNFLKINITKSYISINKLFEVCTNNDCKIRPYKYPNYTLGSVDFETGRNIINTYINDNNIHIEDIFNFDYSHLIRKCRLTQFQDNILDFVVKYYDYKYAGYKFKIASVNYYKDINARIFDMKYLVEKDLKIEILKIPLYITKTMLHEQYSPLYLVLNKKCYDGSLFKWIDECYPNKFIELDFNMNQYRNVFDSFQEAQVDRILRNYCENVIYNVRNSDNEISILDMKPDWIILSRKGTILVEYFGLYANGGKEYKERLEIYKNKMDKKYIKYRELLKIGYKHLYIYPDDLKNNFEGLHKKLKTIK